MAVPVDADCSPLVAGLFFSFCCADVVEAFNSTSGCLDGLFGIGGPCFAQVVGWMCLLGFS